MGPRRLTTSSIRGHCGNAPAIENAGGNMADLIIVYWRDIPAQVIVKKGRQNAKRELPLRFTEAIDMCAMRTGAGDTDAYLAEWRKADPVPVGDDLEAEADEGAGRHRREIRQGAAGRARQGRRQGKWLNIRRLPRPRWSSRQRRNPTTSRPTCRRSGACSAPTRSGCGRCAIRGRSNGSTPGSPTCSCCCIRCGRASATAASKGR